MRVMFVFGCAAALSIVAACNASPSASNNSSQAPGNSAEATANSSAPANVAALIHDRHERYEQIGDAMKGLHHELEGASPSIPTIQRHAALIARYAPQVPSWFPAGSGPDTGARTRAKAEIWSDPQTFRQRADAFAQQAARFEQAAQSGDLAAIRTAHHDLDESCRNCHERFRAPRRGR